MEFPDTMQVKAILWDMDGTLVDSEKEHYITWRDTMARRGIDLSEERFKSMLGMRNDLILEHLYGERPSEEEIETIGYEKEHAYREIVRERGVTVLPGAAHWLKRMHEAGWRQMVASSAPLENIETVIESVGLAPYVEAYVSADEVAHGKPSPDLFIEGARRLGLPPSSCIVVEDAHVGVEAAHRAGMKAIAVKTTHHDVSGDVTVDSLEDLKPEYFDALLEAAVTT